MVFLSVTIYEILVNQIKWKKFDHENESQRHEV